MSNTKQVDIIEQYVEEKNVQKLKEILELSRSKVKDLENALDRAQEAKLLEAFRKRDNDYLKQVVSEMENNQGEEINNNIEIQEAKDSIKYDEVKKNDFSDDKEYLKKVLAEVMEEKNKTDDVDEPKNIIPKKEEIENIEIEDIEEIDTYSGY